MKSNKYFYQKNTDVIENNTEYDISITKIVKDLIGDKTFKLIKEDLKSVLSSAQPIISSPAAQVNELKGIPLEEVTDEHFIDVSNASKPVPPILISNMVDNIPEEFNEVGIGEGNISKTDEKVLLFNTIKIKIEESTLTKESQINLSKLLQNNLSSLGLKQSNAQMSLMTPIEVTLKPGVRVLRSDGYQLAPEQEKFLELKFKALQDAGIVEPAKNPIWGHPVFVVPKKMDKPQNWTSLTNSEKELWKRENILNRFRMVSNMVRLNKITVPTSLNLPNLERQLLSVKGSRVYATLDILSGFDFLETDDNSKDIFTLVTRRSAWRLRGAPMGWMNTPALFCDRVVNEVVDGIETLFGRPKNGVICWLDDLLVYAEDEEKLLQMLKLLLIRAAQKQVRFNLRKCDFSPTTTIWCGRQLKEGYWNFSPRFYEKILTMERPIYRHQMAQIVYLANWLNPNIPKLAELRKPFAHYANLEGKRLIDIEKKKEEVEWTPELEENFIKLKKSIVEASKRFLATYDASAPLLLFTDSSYDVWSMAIFQDDHENISNDVRALAPKPLMFLSGSFSTSEVRWHIASKELYPIIYAFERVGFLLRTHPGGLFVYTDHRPLLSILKTKENEKRIYWDRLYRWAIRLQSVDLTVFHIPSRDNFVSDLLTRWATKSEPLLARLEEPLQLGYEFKEGLEGEILMHADLDQEEEEEHIPLIAQLQAVQEDSTLYFDSLDFDDFSEALEYEAKLARLFYVEDEVEHFYCANIRSTNSQMSLRNEDANTNKRGPVGKGDWLKPVDESVGSDLQSIIEELFTEHISYLSPFYYGQHKHLNDRVIKKHQKNLPKSFLDKCHEKENLFYFQEKLVIPKTLIARFIVMNHTNMVHPSRSAESKVLKKMYFHDITKDDFNALYKNFRRRCLHCQREPALIRRPYKLTPVAKRIREIIRADYLYVNSTGYILVLLDSCSKKMMLEYTETPTAEGMVDALLRWRADLGLAEQFCIITDNGSHFANVLMQKLSKAIGFEQTFTIAYSPWSNGSVETANSQILELMRSLTSLYGLYERDWPTLLPIVAYIINNRPVSRRANLTPNEIFLNFRLKIPLIRKSRKFFAIKLADDILLPDDVEELISRVEEVHKIMETRMEKVYNSVLLKREAELVRKNKTRSLITQFAPGDYVMVSTHGTQEISSKIKLIWQGPYQVIDVVSESLYEVESILGNTKLVHGARLWFYGTKPPTSHPNLKSLFMHNMKELEVDQIKSVRLTDGNYARYEALVKWRGFEDSRNTWQDLFQLYEDLPALVRSFIELKLKDTYMKRNILKELEVIDEKRVVESKTKNRKKKNSKKRGETRIAAISKSSYYKIWYAAAPSSTRTMGWYEIEKDILKPLILKFGCGKYEAYSSSPYLPNRSKQQMSSQIQQLLGLQAIGIFHGKHFKVERARKFLETNFGIKGFHKNIPGKLNLIKEREEIIRQFDLEVTVGQKEIQDVTIPYFRGLNDPEHLRLLISEYGTDSCKLFLGNTNFKTLQDLERKLEEYETRKISTLKENEHLIEDCYKFILTQEQFWKTLSHFYSLLTNSSSSDTNNMDTLLPKTFNRDGRSLTIQIREQFVDITYLNLTKDKEVPLRFLYEGGNTFTLLNDLSTFYLEPPNIQLYMENALDIVFDHPFANKNIYTLIILDPPWTVGSRNPTRGVSLTYPTISNSTFKKMKLPLNHFPYGSYLFIWVTNHSFLTVLEWTKDLSFFLVDEMTWIKRHKSGKLHKSLGYFLQHSQQTCLVFEMRSSEKVQYQNTFEEDNIKAFNKYFYSQPLRPSRKPEIFYTMLTTMFPARRTIEFFGRWNNIRENWTTCGLDLTPPAQLCFLQQRRTGSA
eukprot:snap_masked-scaffold_22-processed-gene-2.40-mRNA-1 protein AED:0.48 eAED:0.48 QI:0/-1/0/1/-1/1/1/0/1851